MTARRILVTGGAGYVGSHVVLHLRDQGDEVAVFDDFSTGHRVLAEHAERVFEGSLLDSDAIASALHEWKPSAVVHCAAKSIVGDSIREPLSYYNENIRGAVHLVEAACSVNTPIVFSSSAAVYGDRGRDALTEDQRCEPLHPYGFTKLVIEHLLADVHRATGLGSISLRYFNAAGADLRGRAGELHEPETHLIPAILKPVAEARGGELSPIRLFGTDYGTPDGTCVRDYIHVDDLARAHALALTHLLDQPSCRIINLGSGQGSSVREVVDAAERIVKRALPVVEEGRRPGDPPVLVAAIALAREVLGWSPRHNLDVILESAWRWHKKSVLPASE